MEHPSHKCQEPIYETIVDGSGKKSQTQVGILIRCRQNNGKTKPMTHRPRKRTRYQPEKPSRCICGRVMACCDSPAKVGKASRKACGCGDERC